MLSRSRTRARSFMRPPQWATGAAKPRGASRAAPKVRVVLGASHAG
jgi:hypothetical protein